ncbi:response regulator transcription factor [Mucilaginibacter ginkgonis]|uniref:Response regulator transcription factor n=1 Tax=Mucilaginibacter ginkgonis TaxID=2682091 RepID=A0A6I4HZN6_9SPHI|nr:response regulator transcription factor [Mucilaginibacter ginkgonis]QQL49424.1 response regulator transcription factor [Mucilaginibacter ginkgonis]
MRDRKKSPIRIVLAEDHQIVRNGLRLLLESEGEMQIVGEAENGLEVIKMLEGGLEADVLITDINMPDLSGMDLLEKLQETTHHLRIVVLSMLDNQKFVNKAFNNGALAYLLKNVANEEMVFAIKQVCAGNKYLCSEIAISLLNRQIKSPEKSNATIFNLHLTDRDVEVLSLIANGYTNEEIADKLFTSKRTVEGYRQSLITRSGARNMAALIKLACLDGLLS